jgi:hypothetical protein
MKPNIRYIVTKSSDDETFLVGDKIELDDGGNIFLISGDSGWIESKDVEKAINGMEYILDREFHLGEIDKKKKELDEMNKILAGGK